MAYSLKTVRYKGRDCHILLQNENGPCPLLAAANALLLRGNTELPPHAIRNSVASLEVLTNMLANHAMMVLGANNGDNAATDGGDASSSDASAQHHYVDELLVHIPKFQYGMDVNPRFTDGIAGYEYTAELTAFDLLRVKLVHGWLVDPHEQSEVHAVVGNDTYNSLVEKVIHGNEASSELERVHQQQEMEMAAIQQQAKVDSATTGTGDLLDDQNDNNTEQAPEAPQTKAEDADKLKGKCDELHAAATKGSLINNFLQSTANQLTIYGLHALYEGLQDDELTVFFRNNHFATLTKDDGILYLLVTDLGYANVPNIVWEKLDVIDGDTEYVDSQFKRAGEQQQQQGDGAASTSGPTLEPEQLLAQSGQKDADYQLALHLSKQPSNGAGGAAVNTGALDAQEGKLMAAATEASLRSYHGLSDGIQPPKPQQSEESKQDSSGEAPRKEVVAVGLPFGKNPTIANNNNHNTGTVAQLPPQATASGATAPDSNTSHEDADKLLAMQLQAENEPNHDDASLHLARQLQEEENRRARRQQQQRPQQAAAAAGGGDAARASNCVIS